MHVLLLLHLLLPMQVLQHLIGFVVAYAVGIVVCAIIVAYVTADAMLYMRAQGQSLLSPNMLHCSSQLPMFSYVPKNWEQLLAILLCCSIAAAHT